MDYKKIGQFLKEKRISMKLTQDELGAKLYVSNKTISKWENGKSFPQAEYLKPLSEILGVSVNEIILGSSIKESEKEKIFTNTIINMMKKSKKKKWIIFIIDILAFICFMSLSIILYSNGLHDKEVIPILIITLIVVVLAEIETRMKY